MLHSLLYFGHYFNFVTLKETETTLDSKKKKVPIAFDSFLLYLYKYDLNPSTVKIFPMEWVMAACYLPAWEFKLSLFHSSVKVISLVASQKSNCFEYIRLCEQIPESLNFP